MKLYFKNWWNYIIKNMNKIDFILTSTSLCDKSNCKTFWFFEIQAIVKGVW